MRLESLRAFALAQPQTTVVKQWGENLVFKVAGKMFLIVGLDGALAEGATLKCTPEEFDELIEIESIAQAPYCAKRHWVRSLISTHCRGRNSNAASAAAMIWSSRSCRRKSRRRSAELPGTFLCSLASRW
jgi:predicted DNA-binding protein (MmcQ/YjbR family)